MTTFKTLPENKNIQILIKETFDLDLPLSGDWGYTQERASIINTLPQSLPLKQLEHTLTSIRAHIEMNITQEKAHRYGGINANEIAREQIKSDKGTLDKVTYKITAMQEDLYNTFIKEYKEGYGKETFDLNAHFLKREESTLTREVIHYFDVTQLT